MTKGDFSLIQSIIRRSEGRVKEAAQKPASLVGGFFRLLLPKKTNR